MVSNWVERRAAREQHLRSAADVWRKARTAILQAIGSLRRCYADVPTLELTEHNRNHIIEITASNWQDHSPSVVVDVQFLAEAPQTSWARIEGGLSDS